MKRRIFAGAHTVMDIPLILVFHSIHNPSHPAPSSSPLTPPFLTLQILLPIQPTPRILPDLVIPALPRQLRRRPTPHPALAVEDHFRVGRGLREAEFVFEFLGGQEERVGGGFDGDVEAGGDVAGCVFGGFADV